MNKDISIFLISIMLLFLCSCDNNERGIKFSVQMKTIESVVPCSNVLDEPYGICAHITRTNIDYPYIEEILKLIEELNITWVRSDFDWSSVSDSPESEFDYSLIDNVFKHLENHPSIHLLPIVTYYGNYPQAQNPRLQILEYYNDWLNYLDAIVSRYHNACPVWEGLNEWEYWVQNGAFDYQDAVRFQADIYNIVKRYNPNALVLLGALSSSPEVCNEISSIGAQKFYDIYNLHTYSSAAPENNLLSSTNQISQLYRKFSFEKPVWATEFGYSTAKGELPEEPQAYFIPRNFIIGFSQGMDKMFLYSLRSREGSGMDYDHESHFGIVHKDLSPKPAYFSVRNITRMLPSGSTRPVLYNIGTIYVASWVHPELGKVYAIWNNGEAKKIALAFQGTPHCYSYMDIENELEIDDYGQFEIGPGIIYITGATNIALI